MTFLALQAPASIDWPLRDADRLLALLATAWPWDVRLALAGERPVILATLPAGVDDRRTRWLDTVVRTIATGSITNDPPPAADTDLVLDTVRWLATGKRWQPLDAEGPGLRLAIPGEHDLPPLAVRPCPTGLRLERPLPLLPLRGAPSVVRLVAAHAALVLNGTLRAARLAIRDAGALTFAVECVLPPDDPDETELECALEGVRHAGPYAAGVLECLRNPAVATAYAIAHSLPVPPTDPEHVRGG